MSLIKSYGSGWKGLFNYKRIWLWLYIANVLFALVAAMPLHSLLKNKVNNSLAFDQVEKFNFSHIGDMMIHFGDSIDLITSQGWLLILLYLILSIFLVAGITGTIRSRARGSEGTSNGRYSFSNFITYAAENFWRFLRLALYILIIKLAIVYLAYKIWTVIGGGTNFFTLDNSAMWTKAFKLLLPIVIFLFTIISMFGDYIKMAIVHSKQKLIFKDVIHAFRNILQKPFTAFGLYFLNIISVALILMLIALLRRSLELNSMSMVILSVLLTQLIIIVRLGFKIVNLKSIDYHIENLSS